MDTYYYDWIKSGNIEDEGMFWGQKSNSAYAVVNMSMQFYHTWDEAYTRKVYPFVKGVATFWENYLTREGDRYVIYNDAIHEGTVGTMNPILSLGLVRMVMQTVSDMSALLGVFVFYISAFNPVIIIGIHERSPASRLNTQRSRTYRQQNASRNTGDFLRVIVSSLYLC